MNVKTICFYAICDAVRNYNLGNITLGEYEEIIQETNDMLLLAGVK
jgi:hypothetical protein